MHCLKLLLACPDMRRPIFACTPLPCPALPAFTHRYYDVIVGTGPEAVEGKRVVVHFEAKWKGVTFITTR